MAVKVLCVPVNIFSPRDSGGSRTLDYRLEIGMCFAGSAVSSPLIKESLAELLKELQYAPGYTDVSMNGLATFMFSAYRQISASVCSTAIGGNGRAAIAIAGRCPSANELRAFLFETDESNHASMRQILASPGEYEIIGSGTDQARSALPKKPRAREFLNALSTVINSTQIDSVGGPIQYGTFREDEFRCFGATEFDGSRVRYWRAGLDVNSEEFISGPGNFVPGSRFLESVSSQDIRP